MDYQRYSSIITLNENTITKTSEFSPLLLIPSVMKLLKGHDHGTDLVIRDYCDACDDRSCSDSIICYDCNFSVHNKCSFVFSIQETDDHLSHDGHCLKLLTTGAPDHTDPKCHLCGKNTKRLLYHCSTCNLNLDIDCMVNDMSARASINMPWHHHPLVRLDLGFPMLCEVCGHPDGYSYFCPTCKLMVHEKCVSVFDEPEINHPFHVRHSLKLLTEGAPDYTDPECHVCGKHTDNFLYHCDICKFNLDMACAVENHLEHELTPIVLSNLKIFEHTLTLIPKLISFICDACGMDGDRSPYLALQGNHKFFHQQCAHLPSIIHVNRHDHRVSYKYPLGLGEWTCEICLEDIDWSCGAYFCSSCPDYALHSRCATRKDVWDEEELDGILDEIEDSKPFKLNEDNTITHFTHEEHKMSLNKEGKALVESILCKACVRPIASNTFYNCSACTFILHETCANLPKKKRLFLSPKPLRLRLISDDDKEMCNACLQFCCEGLMYTDGEESFDLLCCSITVPFIHESHEHPLLYLENDYRMNPCHNCGNNTEVNEHVLGCIKCDYYLDFHCATLPSTVRLLRYDYHPLTLCYGEEETRGKYWCDVCEREVNPKKWFYTCNDCSVTLHIFCVLGDLIRYAKPGANFNEFTELMFNNTSWRPICNNCDRRCMGPFFLRSDIGTFCSCYCLCLSSMEFSVLFETFSRPPWIE